MSTIQLRPVSRYGAFSQEASDGANIAQRRNLMSKLSRVHVVVLVVFTLSILALTVAVASAALDKDSQVTVANVEFIG
jgi:hypothetical protein